MDKSSEVSFIGKDFGFVQTRDQEQLLSIALFKSIRLQLPKKLDLVYEILYLINFVTQTGILQRFCNQIFRATPAAPASPISSRIGCTIDILE